MTETNEKVANTQESIYIDLSPVENKIAKLAETMEQRFNDMKKVEENTEKEDPAKLKESIPVAIKKGAAHIIPVAVGGFAAIVVSEVIDGVMVKQKAEVRGIVKVGSAAVVYAWGKKIPGMGETGKSIMAGLLLFDALRDLTPISSWSSQIANKISGAIPVGGLADQHPVNRSNVISQADMVAGDYYSRLGGR